MLYQKKKIFSTLYCCMCVVAGPPGKVGGLELTYHSEQELRLQWSRPGDFPSDVLITYHINITNTSSGAVTQVGHDTCVSYETTVVTIAVTVYCPQSYETTETYVLVSQTGEGDCQPHLFSVTASNDAGTSPASTIMESIPICELCPVCEQLHTYIHTYIHT